MFLNNPAALRDRLFDFNTRIGVLTQRLREAEDERDQFLKRRLPIGTITTIIAVIAGDIDRLTASRNELNTVLKRHEEAE